MSRCCVCLLVIWFSCNVNNDGWRDNRGDGRLCMCVGDIWNSVPSCVFFASAAFNVNMPLFTNTGYWACCGISIFGMPVIHIRRTGISWWCSAFLWHSTELRGRGAAHSRLLYFPAHFTRAACLPAHTLPSSPTTSRCVAGAAVSISCVSPMERLFENGRTAEWRCARAAPACMRCVCCCLPTAIFFSTRCWPAVRLCCLPCAERVAGGLSRLRLSTTWVVKTCAMSRSGNVTLEERAEVHALFFTY